MKNGETKKNKVTLETLAAGITRIEDKIDTEIEGLAIMVANGFEDVKKELRKEITGTEERLGGRIQGLSNRIDDMYMRKTDVTEYTKIVTRVEVLEKKTGIKVIE